MGGLESVYFFARLTWRDEKVVDDVDCAITGQYVGLDCFCLVELQRIKRDIHFLPEKSLKRTRYQIVAHEESGSNVIEQKLL